MFSLCCSKNSFNSFVFGDAVEPPNFVVAIAPHALPIFKLSRISLSNNQLEIKPALKLSPAPVVSFGSKLKVFVRITSPLNLVMAPFSPSLITTIFEYPLNLSKASSIVVHPDIYLRLLVHLVKIHQYFIRHQKCPLSILHQDPNLDQMR